MPPTLSVPDSVTEGAGLLRATDPAGQADRPEELEGFRLLRTLFRTYFWRILGTYALFVLENVVRLAEPYVLGLAIDDLLRLTDRGFKLLVALYLGRLVIGLFRRLYDARTFRTIFADLATQLVLKQRRRGVEVSRIAARSELSRQFVSFFERDILIVMHTLFSVVGALVLLALHDAALVGFCLAVVVPVWAFNYLYGRKTLFLSSLLHDELEREVAVIGRGRSPEVRRHYRLLARWHVKLADWEAFNFGVLDLLILALTGLTLLWVCAPGSNAGEIFMVFRYVVMFTAGLDVLPTLVFQFGRLRDISRRLRRQTDRGGATSGGVDPRRGQPGGSSTAPPQSDTL